MSNNDSLSPANYGTPLKYDPEFKGPRKRRSCTDIICFFLFSVFLVIWAGIGYYAFVKGDPEKILKPSDSSGRKCGFDSEVLDRPYLFFFDLTKCAEASVIFNGCSTPQVCVKKCPNQRWTSTPYTQGVKPFDLADIKHNLICISDEVKNGITNTAQLKNAIDANECASWYIETTPSLDRCLPKLDSFSVYDWLKNLPIPDAASLITNATEHLKYLAYTQQMGMEIFEDLKTAWKMIVASFSMAVVVSLVYIVLLRWIAGIMTWLSIIGVVALTITGSVYSYFRYDYLRKYGPPDVKNKMILGELEKISYTPGFWMALTVIVGIAALIIFLLAIFLRKRIVIAITLIKEGSKAVSSIISSLFFPLFPWLLQCAVFIWVLCTMFYLMSIGKDVFKARGLDGSSCTCTGEYSGLKTGDICDPQTFQTLCREGSAVCIKAGCHFYKQEQHKIISYFEWFNVFGFFWGIWFVSGLSDMILAGSFATWYWTFDKSNVPFFVVTESFLRTFRYHLGTIACGSFIIAICSFIRAVLEYIERKLKRFSDNPLVKAVFCCCKCFFWCLERFLRFINRNAYIMCAIHGKNFCSSASHAFSLLMRNAIRVVVLDKVTDFLFFIGKILISGCMVVISYYLFVKSNEIPLHYNGAVPLVVIGIGSYVIASIFFGVYSMAVDTLFLCFLEDCERNDGSVEKPYFMSKNLMKILGKRNKVPN